MEASQRLPLHPSASSILNRPYSVFSIGFAVPTPRQDAYNGLRNLLSLDGIQNNRNNFKYGTSNSLRVNVKMKIPTRVRCSLSECKFWYDTLCSSLFLYLSSRKVIKENICVSARARVYNRQSNIYILNLGKELNSKIPFSFPFHASSFTYFSADKI